MAQVEEQAQVSSVEEFVESLLDRAISLVPRHPALDVEHRYVADQALPYGRDRASSTPLAVIRDLGLKEIR